MSCSTVNWGSSAVTAAAWVATMTPVWSLAWELPHAMSTAKKIKNRKRNLDLILHIFTGISPVVSEHRKQIDDLKKFKNDFRVSIVLTNELEFLKQFFKYY